MHHIDIRIRICIHSVLPYSCTWFNRLTYYVINSLRRRHNEHDGLSSHLPRDCLLNRLFRRKPKKTSKLRVTGLCEGNSSVTDEFPTQMASDAENVSILMTSSCACLKLFQTCYQNSAHYFPLKNGRCRNPHHELLKQQNQFKCKCIYNWNLHNKEAQKIVSIGRGWYSAVENIYSCNPHKEAKK